MDRFNRLPIALQKSFEEHRMLKVISGLANFDVNSVERIAKAAGQGGADLLDIACDPALVRLAIRTSGLPVCVSGVEPQNFPAAVTAGASIIEIGNFDSFYPQGRIFDFHEVLALTKETRALVPDVVLSVTVPHVLPLHEQEQLAFDLVEAGADLIQTEGANNARPFSSGSLGLIEKAAPTLASVHTLAKAFDAAGCQVPLICASGLSSVTLPMAIAVGASGVGVGSAINRLEDELEMVAVVMRLREALSSSKVNSIK